MEFYLARALQVCCLTETELAETQRLEKIASRYLTNHEIQRIFDLPSIKSWFSLPDTPQDLAVFSGLVETKIKQNGLLKSQDKGFIYGDNLEAIHSYDWGIFKSKDQLQFAYQDASKRPSKLKDMICAVLMLALTNSTI